MKTTYRLAFAFAVLMLPGSFSGAAPVPKDAGGPGIEYYPLVVGTKSVYKVGEVETTVLVAGIERLGKEDCVRVETEVTGGVKVSEVYAKRTDGVYRVKVKDDVIENPVKVLPIPIKLGATWDVNSKLSGQPIKGTMTVKGLREKVKTPAGEFEAVLIESSDFEVAGTKVQMRFWYVKGVGMVKTEFTINGSETVLELVKFTPGEAAPAPRP